MTKLNKVYYINIPYITNLWGIEPEFRMRLAEKNTEFDIFNTLVLLYYIQILFIYFFDKTQKQFH